MSYFKSWRRKVGVVTLAMACMLTVGWVRTIGTTGEQYPIGSSLTLHSAHAEIYITKIRYVDNKFLAYRADDGSPVFIEKGPRTIWAEVLRLPYWSIVVQLIALSCYLLLRNPRIMNKPKVLESTPPRGCDSW